MGQVTREKKGDRVKVRPRLIRLGALVFALSAALASSAYASGYSPYKVPPNTPKTPSASAKALLAGSNVTAKSGWIVVHLAGGPYKIGFQNGYLTAQSANYVMLVDLGAPGSATRKESEAIARDAVWKKVPHQYRLELKGIAAGMQAAGYKQNTLWDVVAANAWADLDCYAPQVLGTAAAAQARFAGRVRKGGCSAFIATGKATSDGRPVMGHNTWSAYDQNFMYNVMFYVHPTSGYDLAYESAGGQIWSGADWYENSAGLMLTETTLVDTRYRPSGIPVFIRARQTAQFAGTVSEAVKTLLTGNNGAYSDEWLIGDQLGTIASLQIGFKAHDLSVTSDGFFGSSNYVWGATTRVEEGSDADPPYLANPDYARFVRWKQLAKQYAGHIDAAVGQTMIADTYDAYLGKNVPDERTICGEPEHGSNGTPYSGDDDGGAYDAKVCTESMALDGMQMWARWGHPNGDSFSAARFLHNNPKWAAENGPLAVFGLRTFSAQTPNPWALLRQ